MKKLSSIALVGLAIVLAAASPSYAAAGHGGPGFSGHEGHEGFEGHHGPDDRHDFDRRGQGGVFIGAPLFWGPDDPGSYTDSPSTWYYCPSYGAYYPTVPSCPEAWVPVPG